MTQIIRSTDRIRELEGDFQRRYEPQFANVLLFQTMFNVVGLRALYFAGHLSSALTWQTANRPAVACDMTVVGAPTIRTWNSITPYIRYNGAQAHTVASNTENQIISNLTMFAIARPTALTGNHYIITKFDSTGANQRQYAIQYNATGNVIFRCSSLGTAASTVSLTSSNAIAANEWGVIAARYVPNATMDIWLNGVQTNLAAGVPANLFAGTAPLQLAREVAGSYLTGDIMLAAVCAFNVPDAAIMNYWQLSRALFGY